MKIRESFVSNSSSCSFICDVCQDVVSGWDVSLSDYELWMCENGHTFHEGCTSEFDEKRKAALLETGKKLTQEQIEEYGLEEEDLKDPDILEDYFMEWRDWRIEAPASMCPICCFEDITIDDEVEYYRKMYNIDADKTLQGIRDNFKSYDEFRHYLRGTTPKPVTCCKKSNE
jgi:hypothetical protein